MVVSARLSALCSPLRSSARGSVTIDLRAGTYRLTAPLILDENDSGLTIQGHDGEEAVVSGNRALDGHPLNWTVAVPAGGEAVDHWEMFQNQNEVLGWAWVGGMGRGGSGSVGVGVGVRVWEWEGKREWCVSVSGSEEEGFGPFPCTLSFASSSLWVEAVVAAP